MMVIEIPVADTVDVRRLSGPPGRAILERALEKVRPGEVVAVWSRGAASRLDIPAWTESRGHRVIGIEARDGYDELFIEKRA